MEFPFLWSMYLITLVLKITCLSCFYISMVVSVLTYNFLYKYASRYCFCLSSLLLLAIMSAKWKLLDSFWNCWFLKAWSLSLFRIVLDDCMTGGRKSRNKIELWPSFSQIKLQFTCHRDIWGLQIVFHYSGLHLYKPWTQTLL